jgi:CheY-like chemotaxis protein
MEMESEPGGGTAAVALVADMMFASRVRGTATAIGAAAVTVTRAEKLVEETRRLRPRVVLVDIDARGVDVPGLIARLKSDPETAAIPVIAFGSHVNAEALRAAREAGADRVLARSAFVRDLPALLGGTPPADDAS